MKLFVLWWGNYAADHNITAAQSAWSAAVTGECSVLLEEFVLLLLSWLLCIYSIADFNLEVLALP